MSNEFSQHDSLLDDVEPPHDDVDAAVTVARSVIHGALFDDGITKRHKQRTGRHYAVPGGFANSAITSYVEHAFLVWLLKNRYGVTPDAVGEGANCQGDNVDPEVFFPRELNIDEFLADTGVESTIKIMELDQVANTAAKAVCEGCPFSLECLTSSIIEHHDSGVWGGLDENERRIMIKRFDDRRREYNNGKMKKEMRREFENHAEQIANATCRAAKGEREALLVASGS